MRIFLLLLSLPSLGFSSMSTTLGPFVWGHNLGNIASVSLAPYICFPDNTCISSSSFGALTAGSIPFSNGSSFAQDNANLFWDNTNKRLFIGANPTSSGVGASGQLEIEATGGSGHAINIFTQSTNNAIEVQAQNANVAELSLSNNVAAGGAAITLERARGTVISKTQMKAGDVFGGLFFQGYTGSAFAGYGAAIAAVATQDVTSTNSGAQIVFTTSPNGTNAGNTVRLTIDQDGTITATQKIVGNNGVVLATSGSQPTCTVSIRGMMWNIQGGSGVADTFQVCQKKADNTYGWITK
jgi:glucose/arabinose dehydrogenase